MSDKDNPLIEEMQKFQNEVTKMISDFYVNGNPLSVFSRREWTPPTDVYETENEVCIKMEIAGMNPDDIHVIVDDDRVTLHGCREDCTKKENVRFRQMEIKYTRFHRQFLLPSSADENDVKASYREGFLTVRIGRKAAKKKKTSPTQIKVT